MAKKADNKKKGFEQYLNEIESIVERLESGETDLDEAIEFYEKGIKLADNCSKSLKDAKLKIEVLKKKTDNGYTSEELDKNENSELQDEDSDGSDENDDYDDDDEDEDGDGTLPF